MDSHNVKSLRGGGGLVCFTKYMYSEIYPCCINSSFKFIAQLHKIRYTHTHSLRVYVSSFIFIYLGISDFEHY